MNKPINRVVLQRTKTPAKIIYDYLTRKEAIVAYYELCDRHKIPYGKPVYEIRNGLKTQVGMEAGKDSDFYNVILYI